MNRESHTCILKRRNRVNDEDEDEGEEGLSDSLEAINLYFFLSSLYLILVDWDVELVLPEQECPCLDLS
jgi:hypothetical protein